MRTKCDLMVLKQLFFHKITKNRPAAGGFARRSLLAFDGFELQYTSLLNHVSQFRHFRSLSLGLSPLLERVLSYLRTPGHGI